MTAGETMAARCILHVDMDAFFAVIEQRRHPELRGKPLIVGGAGDPRRRGVVSTASYEARRYGVCSGMPLRTAYQHCPACIFLPVDYAHYTTIARQIKAILKRFSAVIEDAAVRCLKQFPLEKRCRLTGVRVGALHAATQSYLHTGGYGVRSLRLKPLLVKAL